MSQQTVFRALLAHDMRNDDVGTARKGAVKAVSQWHFREALAWPDVMRVFDNYTISKLTMNRLKEALVEQGPKRPS